jgi:hypothetical protein
MVQKYILFLLFLVSGNLISAQDNNLEISRPMPGSLLKVDGRALLLQPKISYEFFLSKRLSLEGGACYFWTGFKTYFTIDPIGSGLFGVGPAKGYYLVTDLKYYNSHGFYLGLGYCYRYSHFSDRPTYNELEENVYQKLMQSEKAYSNYICFTAGWNEGRKRINYNKKKIYINPYVTFMIGPSHLHLKLDTTDTTLPTFNSLQPINDTRNVTHAMLIIGLNFCINPINRATAVRSKQ